jgi:hypothetical protein
MTRKLHASKFLLTRRTSGSAIVEGVAGLGLVIFGTICAALFLYDTGVATYHKNKLGFVTAQTAHYAASLAEHDLAAVRRFAVGLLNQMGISSTDTTLSVTNVEVEGRPGVRVELSNRFPLFESSFRFLPGSILLSDSAACVTSNYASNMEGSGFMKMTCIQPGGPTKGGSPPQYSEIWIPVVGSTPGTSTWNSTPPLPGVIYKAHDAHARTH